MRALHAAAECYPVVRTGGLGDVLAALPAAQRALGIDARLLLPGYPAVLAALEGGEHVLALGPVLGAERADILRGRFAGSAVPIYAIDAAELFTREGNPYLGPDGLDWPDNLQRFGLLSWAAAVLARGGLGGDWCADVLHAHDWHAGLAPAYAKLAADPRRAPGIVQTIHNLAFQGLFPLASEAALGLPAVGGLEFWGQLSFMKAGLVHADRITTVSPGYAREIATPAFGNGLDGVIAARGADVSGILNGVDDAQWNPERDPALATRFGPRGQAKRAGNRRALIAEFGLADAGGPLFGIVSRLSHQKGLDLVLAALPTLLDCGGSLVLLGVGDAELERGFTAAAAAVPGRIAVALRLDDALSRRIFGGSDVLLVPSRFEPGGLTQLYAMRYGAIPVVRRTGGLGDTVHDATPEALAAGTATGIVFDGETPAAVAAALRRTAALHADRTAWTALQRAAMASRFPWSAAAEAYRDLYRGITAAP
ncbi:MAG TPA: glycogen synthase GlgA [Stellaceae bacterium]|nr:glycogen synthase GlgA [Stellaceae bacterium]